MNEENRNVSTSAAGPKLGFGAKLTITLLAVALIPFSIALFTTVNVSTKALEDQALAKLNSLRESKSKEIEAYLAQIRDQVLTLSESEMTVYSAQRFTEAFFAMPEELFVTPAEVASFRRNLSDYYEGQFDAKFIRENGKSSDFQQLIPSTDFEIVAQHQYIAANPEPLGAKEGMDSANDGTAYAKVHDTFHNRYRSYLNKFGYYDIFIVEPETGHIVYSVFKELDYATSLSTGPYKDTNFAEVFNKAAAATEPGEVFFTDFKPYVPSYDSPASFIASPIFDGRNLVGVLIFQMPVDRVNAVMLQEAGMGESGEIVLIGSDQLMRSQSRLVEDNTILAKKLEHEAAREAIAGESGTHAVSTPEGELLSSYAPLEFLGTKWAVVASIKRDEALAAASKIINLGSLIGVIALAAIIGVAFVFRRSVFKQLGTEPAELNTIAENIANGRFDKAIEERENPQGIFASMVIMQKDLHERMENDRVQNERNLRRRMALDSVRSSVMMINDQGKITYTNDAAENMFRADEANLQRQLGSEFNAAKMIGTNLKVFGVGASSPLKLVEGLQDSKTQDSKIGDTYYRLTATPVFDQTDKRIGTVIEWVDRTQETAVEAEMQSIINSAKMGDLSQRIDLMNKENFFHVMSSGVNDLLDVANNVINDTVRVLSALSQGKLTERISKEYEGSFGELKKDANETIDKLIEVVTEIKNSADSVTRNANEIAQGNSNLSHRTEQQAGNLEKTASSMEEMTATVKQNSDNAQQANQLALNAREQAESGGAVVGQAVDAMRAINDSSKQIADIISVIDEIAFQTNLLALNASVEAARAGEQGRGFAVVASEVRNLAGRSATAAKEIKDLIEDSVVKVEDGAKLVDKSGETLDEIVVSVKKVTDIVGEIAAASREQSTGIEQVNSAVMQMDEVTQQNTALVEEAAAASAAMGEEASQLKRLVSFFSMDSSMAGGSASAPAFVERRSAERPWSQQAEAPESTAEPDTAPEAAPMAATGTDDDWEEF